MLIVSPSLIPPTTTRGRGLLLIASAGLSSSIVFGASESEVPSESWATKLHPIKGKNRSVKRIILMLSNSFTKTPKVYRP